MLDAEADLTRLIVDRKSERTRLALRSVLQSKAADFAGSRLGYPSSSGGAIILNLCRCAGPGIHSCPSSW